MADLIKIDVLPFSIGLGFAISMPKFYKSFDDLTYYRYLSFIVYFCSIQLCVNIPLWSEGKGAE